MNPEIHRLFEAAIQLPPEERIAFLEAQTSDPEIRREVLSLLDHDALAESFFAGTFESATSSLISDLDLRPGTRVGAFTIVRMLGFGGMGTVYLGTRAAGGFKQTVAIKVIQAPNPTPLLLARFQQERQILARLNHPNIARLLDGGETPAGSPFFVMEYVSGREIDGYCDDRGLDLRARLRLFLEVAAGVRYAHENLVVHRDLKPGNILVGEDGVPKLLDFGIAKVLDPISGLSPEVSTRVLTPEYASPEQVRGDAITTAADIYSLGAVLYRLLTGGPPHRIEGLSPLDAARKISEQNVQAPPNVPADVGAILTKALHTDPQHRYRSADELSNDIQRYLDGKPVVAASDSIGYKTAKFLRRNWIAATASLAVMLALTAGAGAAIWQGRRAERRFAEVRQLSNQFLFEFEDAIHSIPGTMKARELVVKTAQEYLDRLAGEAGRDPELIHELAEAYQKLGDVQGNQLDSNTGNYQAALQSFRTAVTLRDSAGDAHATANKVRSAYLNSLNSLANSEAATGDPTRALPLCQKAVAAADSWLQSGSSDPELLTAVSNSYSQLAGHQQQRGDFEAAVVSSKHSLEIQIRARELRPDDKKLLRAVAVRYWSVGSAEKLDGHFDESIAAYGTAKELLQQVVALNPGNTQNRRELLGASWLLADTTVDLLRKKKLPLDPGVPLWREAFATGTHLLSEDPANALVEADVTLIAMGLSTTLQSLGQTREALEIVKPAILRQERRNRTSPENRTVPYYLALLLEVEADCHKDLHDLPAALKVRRTAMRILETLVRADPANFQYRHDQAVNLRETGDILAEDNNFPGARDLYRQGLQIAESLPKGPSRQDPQPLIASLREAAERVARK